MQYNSKTLYQMFKLSIVHLWH